MFADLLAVVRSVDDQRIFLQPICAQRRKHLADHRVQSRHQRPVGGASAANLLHADLFDSTGATPHFDMRVQMVAEGLGVLRRGDLLVVMAIVFEPGDKGLVR